MKLIKILGIESRNIRMSVPTTAKYVELIGYWWEISHFKNLPEGSPRENRCDN